MRRGGSRLAASHWEEVRKGLVMTVFHRVTEGKLGSHDGCTIEDEVSQEFLDRIPGGLFRYRADDEGGTIDYVSRDVLELFGRL